MDNSSRRTYGIISMVLAGLNALGVAAAVGLTLWTRQPYGGMYSDFGVELPATTEAIVSGHWSLWVLCGLAGVVLLAAKEWLPWKRLTLSLNVAVMAALFAYVGALQHILQHPLFGLFEPLQGK